MFPNIAAQSATKQNSAQYSARDGADGAASPTRLGQFRPERHDLLRDGRGDADQFRHRDGSGTACIRDSRIRARRTNETPAVLGASASNATDSAKAATCATISRRRSTRSPSGTRQTRLTAYPNALVFLSDLHGNSFQNTYWNEFGPRLDVAYQINRHMVLQGGYGIMYSPPISNGFGLVSIDGYNGSRNPHSKRDPVSYWDNGVSSLQLHAAGRLCAAHARVSRLFWPKHRPHNRAR